jgi:KipI family sensor histidine kinase inhibitor
MSAAPEIVPLGATALLARFGDRIDRDLTARIARLVDRLGDETGAGIVDLVPSYTTLVVLFDPERAGIASVSRLVTDTWKRGDSTPSSDDPQRQKIEIPVVYGGEAGPDLEDVARHVGLSPDEVIRRHSEAAYTVGALGFSPGFAFLIGLPPELATPRRATPRTRVPAGSVGIGGVQTGIYSLPTPGGWSLIGRTPRQMFDPADEADAGLRLGDRVRFVPVDAVAATPFPDVALAGHEAMPADGALEIVEPGVQASLQDLGRPGQARSGITPGGAMDRAALVAGNRLLGNPEGAAAIEWTLLPPAIRFHAPCRVALTGAAPGWRIDGVPVRIGEVVESPAGAELRAAPGGGMVGARGYLCVAGGIDVPEVRGSRSLDLAAGFGGGFGRPLRAGDRLPLGSGPDSPGSGYFRANGMAADPAGRPFRIVRGPQAGRFGVDAWRTFLAEPFRVDAQSNRMGLRLNGPALVPDGADLISEGVVTGDIQVTGSGQPIVLLRGRATIGGYPKIATVIEADHDRLGQLRPGATIRFAEVSLDEAASALRAWRPSVYGGLSRDEEPTMPDDRRTDPTADAWTPDGVIRVIRELAGHDVRAFSLRVASAGLEIAIDRGGGLPDLFEPGDRYRSAAPNPSESDGGDNPKTEDSATVTAPLLGTFYRRPAPEQPPFVAVGDRVAAGQTVGTIEVMKSFHDVTAPAAGVVARVLVDDGATVEYGQPLFALDPLVEE